MRGNLAFRDRIPMLAAKFAVCDHADIVFDESFLHLDFAMKGKCNITNS
jgi:hypothetical protein